jgi:arylsulfatase A-like enzyme
MALLRQHPPLNRGGTRSRRSLGRRQFLAASGCAGALAAAGVAPASRARPDTRPNLIVVVVDDLRHDEFGAGGHPYLETPHLDALSRGGATFRNAYHTTPLCSPNRACILTGQYASRHGIIDNTSRSHASHRLATFARELQRAGYETAHVGKWHMGNDPTPRPGYDHWVSFAGQGDILDPELFEDGRLRRVPGYITDLLNERAIDFATRRRSRPFMLYVGHKAVHPQIAQRDDGTVDVSTSQGFVAAERHRGRYRGKVFPRPANYGLSAQDRAGKPLLSATLDAKKSAQIREAFGDEVLDDRVSDGTIQARAEMMLAVDEGIGQLVAALEEKSLWENTLLVFMSDNGSFFGEHGLSVERRFPYEESIRSPLILHHGATLAAREVREFALSVDIAPTLLEAAGVAIPRSVQGRSMLAAARGQPTRARDSFLVEYHGHENPFPWIANIDYRAIRMGRYKYIRWIREDDAHELYDLESDPGELRNLAGEPEHSRVVADARAKLAALVLESLGLTRTRLL